jgi:hypothetical protein
MKNSSAIVCPIFMPPVKIKQIIKKIIMCNSS